MDRLCRSCFHACSMLVLAAFLFATSAPALWRMHCLLSDRVVTSWVKAKGCLPAREHADRPCVASDCCETSVAAAHVDEFQGAGTLRSLPTIFIAALPTAPIAAVLYSDAPPAHHAHGPPWVGSVVSELDLGHLRV